MKIENLISVIRSLREQGYNSEKLHIEFTAVLDESLIDNLSELKNAIQIDFHNESLWDYLDKKNIGEKVDIDFSITSECELIIYYNIKDFLESKKSIRCDLSFIGEFYLFEEDCYYKNDFDKIEVKENIEKVISISKFINDLFDKGNKPKLLSKKIHIKDKIIDITFSHSAYQQVFSIDTGFIKGFNTIESDSYKIEKEQILKNSIYSVIDYSCCIDNIIQEWDNILKIYENKLSELVDHYYIEEKESKIYKAKIEAMQVTNTLLSELITKSLSIPLILGGVATINEYTKDKWTILISISGILFTSIVMFLSIYEQEKLAKNIMNSYESLTDKRSFSTELNNKINDSKIEISKNLAKLFQITSLIKAGIITSVIVALFILGSTLIN